jgi:hypothetical protein
MNTQIGWSPPDIAAVSRKLTEDEIQLIEVAPQGGNLPKDEQRLLEIGTDSAD